MRTHPPSIDELSSLGVRFRRPRIYIIDDEEAVLDLLEGYLDDEAYEVRTFTDAFEGLGEIMKRKPEVALVDLKMPGMHGLELVEQAQTNSPATSFVVITGFTTVDTLLDAIRRGVHDYLTKPFSSADGVRIVVRNAVKKHDLEAELIMQAAVTGAILKLGELSCVGEGREAFFRVVRDVFLRLLDATAVASLYWDKGTCICIVDSLAPLTPEASAQAERLVLEKMGLAPTTKVELTVNPLGDGRKTSRFVSEFPTQLPIELIGTETDKVEAQIAVFHHLPESFSAHGARIALSLARNISAIVQSQTRGASHEHQMIVDLFHHLKDGVVVLDRQYRIRYVNPQARRILRIDDKAPLQEALDALAGLDRSLARPRATQSFHATLQKQVAARMDGEERFFDVEAYSFVTPAKVAYRMILFRDVTHVRKEARKIERLNRRLASVNAELTERNRRLEAVIRELDSFAYIASHDLQEPFRHIEIFAQFLERDLLGVGELPGDVAHHLDQIAHNVEIAKTLLADLRTLSKVTRMSNPYRESDLTELVEEVLERFESSIEERGAQVTVDDLPKVVCDGLKIKEVLHNYVSNALKYCEGSPALEITGSELETEVVVCVSDNGIGIAPEFHDYVFQACRRIPFKTNEGEVKGSGLGLAIVKKIIEEHGGRVWVKSVPGEGARFCFSIPTGK
jgi:signal transduction histidine kinase/DNA-binding response OmpR family regulator